MNGDDILNPEYWRGRLEQTTPGNLHHAVFRCPLDKWRRIEAKHREVLDFVLAPADRVLDAGCGWGRLLDLMPEAWIHEGDYHGVDLSPDFIELARKNHPNRSFSVGDLRCLGFTDKMFDWAVMVSVRPMVKRHLGEGIWMEMENELRRVAWRLLYLEYDENDDGSIE